SSVILDAWYAGIRSGMADAISDIATHDIRIWWNGPPDRVPWAGEHLGSDAALAFFAMVGATLEVLRTTVVERIETPDAIVVFLDAPWRVKANGAEIRAKALNVFRFRDGKVSGYEVYPDSAAFVRALTELPKA
ncbi:MAG: nuclear transport factor 2 family protein, partial [Beijerinckiaceae bacterium]